MDNRTRPSPGAQLAANDFARRMGHPLPYPGTVLQAPPQPPEGGIPLALGGGAWLATKTGRYYSDYWICAACPTTGPAQGGDTAGALAHVTGTGHAVEVIHSSRTVYEGVAT